MQPLNAIDAIAPAFTRTHQTLAYPFRIGRAWKLCASQYIAFCGSLFIPYPMVFFFFLKAMPAHNAVSRVLILGMTAFYTVFFLATLYFGSRMELVAFEMLVTRARFIAPMWRRYGTHMWPWLGWKALIGTIACLVVCGSAYVPLKQAMIDFAPLMIPQGAHPDPAALQAMMARIFKVEGVFLALFFLLKIPSTLANDFVLPFFVLEDISMTDSIKRGLEVIAADPLQVALYLLLKPILFVIGFIMLEIAVTICMIPFVIVGVIGAILGTAVLGQHSPAGAIVMVFALIGFYALMIGVFLGAFGYKTMLLEAYGIYFLAGRYPLLANLLDPGPGIPFTPPPVFPSPEERQDDDGSPPMPMNPAVA